VCRRVCDSVCCRMFTVIVTVCCSVLQYVALCCSVLLIRCMRVAICVAEYMTACVAVCVAVSVTVCCSVLQYVAVSCLLGACTLQCVSQSIWQCVLQCMLQCVLQCVFKVSVAVCCSVLQCVAVCCSVDAYNMWHANERGKKRKRHSLICLWTYKYAKSKNIFKKQIWERRRRCQNEIMQKSLMYMWKEPDKVIHKSDLYICGTTYAKQKQN